MLNFFISFEYLQGQSSVLASLITVVSVYHLRKAGLFIPMSILNTIITYGFKTLI